MGRRQSSGFLETVIKSAMGTGTTVRYDKDWLGREQKVVAYHDTGKRKTYTKGCGWLGNVTRTKTEQRGRTVEEGHIKDDLWWGYTERTKRADGTEVERKHRPGLFRKRVTTSVSGPCFKCNGTGSKVLNCKICNGSGTVRLDARLCFKCNGAGKFGERDCRQCGGSGEHKPALDVSCSKCGGGGNFTVTCNRCNGSGLYRKTKIQK
jgi:hypothetical protein